MTSWVYLFSQFTPEALLFEALLIFILCCGYTAFWILRKRRYGIVDKELPSGPVKSYLNELIGNAEQLRLQLFGLLSASDHMPTHVVHRSLEAPRLPDPDLTGLEAKLADQAKALETLNAEKIQLEKSLADARN